jgi:Isochorismatase family
MLGLPTALQIDSQTCVEDTGRHGLEAGYHLTFLKDAVVEFRDEARKAAIQISYPTFGHEVLTVDEQAFRCILFPAHPALIGRGMARMRLTDELLLRQKGRTFR